MHNCCVVECFSFAYWSFAFEVPINEHYTNIIVLIRSYSTYRTNSYVEILLISSNNRRRYSSSFSNETFSNQIESKYRSSRLHRQTYDEVHLKDWPSFRIRNEKFKHKDLRTFQLKSRKQKFIFKVIFSLLFSYSKRKKTDEERVKFIIIYECEIH